MMLQFGLFRFSTFKAVTFVVVVGFCFPVGARAEVKPVDVEDLAAR